jgi:phosphoenolpyruvate phosphomutase
LKKNAQFCNILKSGELDFICEAHNGLSAKIVEEAGFKGIWGSGLTISAQFGVRDNNEASWTQVLDNLEFMSDATSIPILLDGDTGYGNFNNMRRLVNKLEQRDISAVCIEDKIFPKTNSFIGGHTQPLANIDEFSGKIKAAKDAQKDDDFSVIARVEAFIAGWGLSEALKRAEAYHEAGADGILMHSALAVPDEILAFKKEWGDRSPVLIVPTKYYSTPTDVYRDSGISIAIWANHLLRANITTMQKITKTLMEDENLLSIEDNVASVSEVFRLQGAAELKEAEKRYLPVVKDDTSVIILAASQGKDLGDLTLDKPKVMVPVRGKPILSHIVDTYNAINIKDLTVVRGFAKDAVNLSNINFVDNDEYETTGELWSLKLALDAQQKQSECTIISYGDVLFHKYIVQMMQDADDDFVIMVDADWSQSRNRNRHADWVKCSYSNSRQNYGEQVTLKEVSNSLNQEVINGEWMGFLTVSKNGMERVKTGMDTILEEGNIKEAKLPHLINQLIKDGEKIRVLYTTGHWLDVDSLEDIVEAGAFNG